MQVKIEKLDHEGQGIAYVDQLITFVPKTIPGDIVLIDIVLKKKNYQKGEVIKYIKRGSSYQKAICPYYNECGGCSLQNFSYEKTLEYKKDKLKNIFKKIKIDINPIIIKNPSPTNYRNKIELQVQNQKIGFYERKTNNLIPIDKCLITNNCINNFLIDLKKLPITNGKITIRCNQNNELLIIIETKDNIIIPINKWKENNKIAGIILNNKVIHGDNFLIDVINNLIFKISYDSFFQINPYVANLMNSLVKENVSENDKVLDLYCGVGTLSLSAALKKSDVVGIEIIPNAVINAITNARINKLNVKFLVNDVEEAITKIKFNFDTVIVDPPRKGLDKKTIDILNKNLPKKIIYISCDPQTLVRDLDFLKDNYELKKIYLLDMFSYTYHIESFCVLNLR